MRRIRFQILLSAIVTLAVGVPALAPAADNSARVSLPTQASLGCSVGRPGASPRLAIDIERSKPWDQKRRDALANLLVAAERFASAVALHETDHSVLSGDCEIAAAQAIERHVFRRTLEMIVADSGSHPPLMTAREADGALNAAYHEVMAVENPRDLAWGSVEKAGIRKAERAWLAYRDAFLVFAATFETPGVAERLEIELTMRRATSLEALLAD